jgi:hypothetical protein
VHSAQWLELDVAGVGVLHAAATIARILAAIFFIGITVSSTGVLAYVLAGVEYDTLARA